MSNNQLMTPATVNAYSLIPLADIERAAQNFVGLHNISNVKHIISLMLICQAEGLPYAQALQEYDIINNRPALKASALQSRFQKFGGKVNIKKYENAICTVEVIYQQSRLEVTWTLEDAKRAGLAEVLPGEQNRHPKPPPSRQAGDGT